MKGSYLKKKNLSYFTTYISLSKRQQANFQDLNFRFGLLIQNGKKNRKILLLLNNIELIPNFGLPILTS